LEDNLVNPITLPDVAANAGVSLSQLTHAYQKQRGQTVGQRLISLRMEQAAYLLRETDRPLKQISEQVGIHQSAYLCRLFRKHFRLTPGMYRKRHS
jgi:AraC-like DNA-binding protein